MNFKDKSNLKKSEFYVHEIAFFSSMTISGLGFLKLLGCQQRRKKAIKIRKWGDRLMCELGKEKKNTMRADESNSENRRGSHGKKYLAIRTILSTAVAIQE